MSNAMAMLAALQGANNAVGALKPAYEKATSRFDTNYLDPYSQGGGRGFDMLQNALGLRGQEGNQAAMGAFQTSPGYGFQMDQGIQARDRSAAARGMLGSGNHMADLTAFGQGLANQEYGNWVSRLGGLGQMGQAAANAQTGRQGSLAGLDMDFGRAQAGVWSNLGNNLSGMMTDQARNDQARRDAATQNLFGGIAGGLNLGARLAFAPTTGGGSLLGDYVMKKFF